MIRRSTPYALAVLSAVISLGACSRPEISIEQAWVRTPLPGRSMTAGYLVLHNRTPRNLTLTGAHADAFAKVSMHETRLVDGLAEMVSVATVEVAAGDSVTFRPGGLHLMMMQPRREIARGDNVSVAIEFDDGTTITAPARVSDTEPE